MSPFALGFLEPPLRGQRLGERLVRGRGGAAFRPERAFADGEDNIAVPHEVEENEDGEFVYTLTWTTLGT